MQLFFGDRFECFESLGSFEKASFVCWIVSCGRMTVALCLILSRIT